MQFHFLSLDVLGWSFLAVIDMNQWFGQEWGWVQKMTQLSQWLERKCRPCSCDRLSLQNCTWSMTNLPTCISETQWRVPERNYRSRERRRRWEDCPPLSHTFLDRVSLIPTKIYRSCQAPSPHMPRQNCIAYPHRLKAKRESHLPYKSVVNLFYRLYSCTHQTCSLRRWQRRTLLSGEGRKCCRVQQKSQKVPRSEATTLGMPW